MVQQAQRVKALATAGNYLTLWNAFSTQWCDAVLAARDANAKNAEAVVAAIDNLNQSGLSEAASRIEHASS